MFVFVLYRIIFYKSLKFEESILERRLNVFPKTILMYALIKGKHTFVYQPIKQKFNLKANGWVEVADFNDFINGFKSLNYNELKLQFIHNCIDD